MNKTTIFSQLESVRLHRGPWEARVVPAYGMNMLSLLWHNQPVLRTPGTLEEYLQLPEGYGIPPLLPANRTRDGKFSYRGKDYQLPINDTKYHTHKHGFLHTAAFEITDVGENHITGCCVNHGQLYPFPFTIDITCRLQDDGCYQTFRITNTGMETMPFLFALHTAFTAPKTTEIPVREIWRADERCIPTGEKASLPDDLRPYAEGTTPTGEAVGYCCPSVGREARIGNYLYRVSQQFTQWIIWNGSGHDGFLCVEPQTAPSNALQREGQPLELPPNQTIQFETSIIRADGR